MSPSKLLRALLLTGATTLTSVGFGSETPFFSALAENENEIPVTWDSAPGAGDDSRTAEVNALHELLPVSLVADQSFQLNPITAWEQFVDQLDQGSLIAGAEVTFLKASVKTDGRATLTFDDSNTAGTDYRGIGARGIDSFGVAPRLWLGYQITPKWAVVTRYWSFSDNGTGLPATPAGQVNLPNFATFQDAGTVSMAAFDIEAVRSFSLWGWKLDGRLGGRHADFKSSGSVRAYGVFTTGNFVNLSLFDRSRFQGDGVTYAITGRYQVLDTPLSFFINARGSNLAGSTDSKAGVAGTVASSPSAPLVGAATVTRNNANANAAIGELQVGTQLDYDLEWVPASTFLRVAFEYQQWTVDGPPLGGAGFGGTIGTLTTNSFVSHRGEPSASLMGVSVATGLNW